MSSTEDRIKKIIDDNLDLGRAPDFDAKLVDSGVSSVDCVAFFKLVNEEFNLGLVAEQCRQFETLRDLVSFIDARGPRCWSRSVVPLPVECGTPTRAIS